MDDIYCKLSSGILLLILLNSIITFIGNPVSIAQMPLQMIIIEILFEVILLIATIGVFKEKSWAKIMGLVIFSISFLAGCFFIAWYGSKVLGIRFYTFNLLNIAGIFLLYKSIVDKKKKNSYAHKRK